MVSLQNSHATDQGSILLILMCHSGDYSQSDAVRGVVSVQENGSWEEPHDLNGLWPLRLRPLKLPVEGEYINLKDPTHTHREDTLSAPSLKPKMIPHSTHHFLLHCRTTTRTWIGLGLTRRPIQVLVVVLQWRRK